jgi:hypothetical protein
MNEPDNKIDNLISRHLAGQLDRHVGRSQKAFLREVSEPRPRHIPRYWAAAAILLLTASLAGALAVYNLFNRPAPYHRVEREIPVESPPLMPVAQTVDWRTLDDGTVMLNGDVPIRRLRRQIVEHVKWYDPERRTTIELRMPQEQIMLIGNW